MTFATQTVLSADVIGNGCCSKRASIAISQLLGVGSLA
jgi:hypothetical protein